MCKRHWQTSALLLVALTALGPTHASAADPKASKPARLEAMPGSDLKRVILTEKAAKRLAIQTTSVRQEPVNRLVMVEGTVESVGDGPGGGTAIGTPAAHVRIHLLEDPNEILKDPKRVSRVIALVNDDDDDDDDDKGGVQKKPNSEMPVAIIPIGREQGPARLAAKPVQVAAADPNAAVPGTTMPLSLYYEIADNNHGLKSGQRVYVRIKHPESGALQKVVPYSAVLYDPQGNTWVYTNPAPLTYVRHRVDIDLIDEDTAVLRDGPPLNTPVVISGGAELFGVEQKFGH